MFRPTSKFPSGSGSARKLIVLIMFSCCFVLLVQNCAIVVGASMPIVNISTIVGGGSKIGDGLVGTSSLLRYPIGITTSLNGDVYIADYFDHRIRKVSVSNGYISTVAGNGVTSLSGDGGLATEGSLNFPNGVVVNVLGEIFIADTSNHVIRKVSTNGKIETIAGTATSGFSDGSATSSLLNSPSGLAINSTGELLIIDTNNHAIRKLSNGSLITIAGIGTSSGYSGDNGQATSAKLNTPRAATFNLNGEILVADTRNHRIRKVSVNGVISTIAGTGTAAYNGDGIPAKNAQLNYPSGISVNSLGEILIADTYNHRIRKILTNGTIVSLAGNGIAGFSGDGDLAVSGQLNLPFGVAVGYGGEVYISDSYNHRVRKVSTNGFISTLVGTSNFGHNVPSTGSFAIPNGNPVLYGNNLVFADNSGKVRQVDLTSKVLTTLSSVTPLANAVGYLNSEVYVMYINSYLSKVKSNLKVAGTGSIGAYSGDGLAVSETLNNPSSIFVASNGDIYFSDSFNHLIRKLSNGYITTVAGNGVSGYSGDGGLATSAKLNNPKGVVVSSSGEIFISDNENHRIRKVSTSGFISTIAGTGIFGFSGDSGLATSAQLNSPYGIALKSNGDLLIADTRNNRIRKVDSNGYISTVAGNGTIAYKSTYSGDGGLAVNSQLYLPFSVAVNSSTGEFFIADSGNHRIRKVSTSGYISTIAGTGTAGFSGDSGLATSAKINFPFSISIGSSGGELFIADQYNQRIRKIATNGYISTVAGNGAIGFNGDGLIATSSKLNYPNGVASSSGGDVYIVDSINSRIRKVSAGKISTIAGGIGNGSPAVNSYLSAQSFTSSSSGEIYIADSGNNVIRKIDTNGYVSTIAGSGVLGFSGDGGLATSAMLNNPGYVVVSSSGEIFISDTNNHRIRKVSTSGYITTIAGNGTAAYSGDGGNATIASLNYPSGIAMSSTGEIYIADSYNHRIRKINANGTISTVIGNGVAGFGGDGALPTSAMLNYPTGVAISSIGEVYVSDNGNNRIRKVSLTCSPNESVVNGMCVKVIPQATSPSSSPNVQTSRGTSVTPTKSDRVSGASSVMTCLFVLGLAFVLQIV